MKNQLREVVRTFAAASDASEQPALDSNLPPYPWGKVHILSFPKDGDGETRAQVESTQPFAKNLQFVSVIAKGGPAVVSLLNNDGSDAGFFRGLYVPEDAWIDLRLPTETFPKGIQETEWRVQANRLNDSLQFVQLCERCWALPR